MIITDVMKITKSGQVTIPKVIRDILKIDTIAFEVSDNNEVHLIPIPSVAGALRAFSKGNDKDFKTIRDIAWKEETARYSRSSPKHKSDE